MVIVNYALQVCDIASNQSVQRYCSNSKTEVTVKCVTSFLHSVAYAAEQNRDAKHRVMIFDDKSSQTVVDFLQRAQEKYSKDNVEIVVKRINSTGIMDSIRTCWEWLRDQEGDLVYQVQDDYLFKEDAIYQMICMFMQVLNDINEEIVINPYNDPHNWYCKAYHYKQTPRVFTAGLKQYWIQCYDIACTFMTSKQVFNSHWDLYEKFLVMDPNGEDGNLENVTINRILVDRKVLGYMPVESIALHMQSEFEKDPYINWKERWNAVPTI